MPAQIIQHPDRHLPRYDAVEILLIAAGVLFVVAVALVF